MTSRFGGNLRCLSFPRKPESPAPGSPRALSPGTVLNAVRSSLRFRRKPGCYVSLAHSYGTLRTAFGRRRYCQILGPSRHPPKFANGLCRHVNIWVDLDLRFIWPAAKKHLERGNTLCFVSHQGFPPYRVRIAAGNAGRQFQRHQPILRSETRWGALAIYHSNLPGAGLRLVLAVAFVIFAIWAVWLSRHRRMTTVFVVLYLCVVAWWISISPSNDRNWRQEVAVMPWAAIDGDRVRITGVRNFDYRSRDDFTVRHEHATSGAFPAILPWSQRVRDSGRCIPVPPGRSADIAVRLRPRRIGNNDPLCAGIIIMDGAG
jgi:hypothetical protein